MRLLEVKVLVFFMIIESEVSKTSKIVFFVSPETVAREVAVTVTPDAVGMSSTSTSSMLDVHRHRSLDVVVAHLTTKQIHKYVLI